MDLKSFQLPREAPVYLAGPVLPSSHSVETSLHLISDLLSDHGYKVVRLPLEEPPPKPVIDPAIAAFMSDFGAQTAKKPEPDPLNAIVYIEREFVRGSGGRVELVHWLDSEAIRKQVCGALYGPTPAKDVKFIRAEQELEHDTLVGIHFSPVDRGLIRAEIEGAERVKSFRTYNNGDRAPSGQGDMSWFRSMLDRAKAEQHRLWRGGKVR